MNEAIINRIRMLLAYLTPAEIRAKFPELSEGDFFLAYMAAKCMERTNV